MKGNKRSKVVICADYQGDGAVIGSTTGFQRSVSEWIHQAGVENTFDVVLYCIGDARNVRKHKAFSNITIKQYKTNLGIWSAVPFLPTSVFPFRVDLMPVHLDMVVDIIKEQPDIIHTMQTFGATDISGFLAAHAMKMTGRKVRLINSVMTEIDTYFGSYVKVMADYLLDQIALKSFGRILQDCSRAQSRAAAYEGHVSTWKMMRHAAPLAFWYGLAKVFDSARRRRSVVKLFSDAFRALLAKEIPLYLNHCDAVTMSRPDDLVRYRPKRPVWEVPSACDLNRFKIYDPMPDKFLTDVGTRQRAGYLSGSGANELTKMVADPKIVLKRPILYVGRLSDEKNISYLIHGYARLLREDKMREKVHFVFIGPGQENEKIRRIFGWDVTLTGLVPNDLLPDIYNIVRLRNGFFISASDTETFGITHEEAVACGVPIVAMQAGTRNHVFRAGDYIGECLLKEDPVLSQAFAAHLCKPTSYFTPALNGVVIPDFSGGLGLSCLPEHHSGRALAQEAVYQAMRAMATLPSEVMNRMAWHAALVTQKSKLGWALSWRLLSHCVYPDNRLAHEIIFAPRKHHCH